MDYYPAINKNEILTFVSKWLEIEQIILDEVA